MDATPTEGFDPVEFDELLGLDKLELKSAVILTPGHRAEGADWLVNLKAADTKGKFITEIE